MSECSSKTDTYKKGDRVYAQFPGFPPWPAKVQKRADGNEEKYYVYFYGTYDWACITPQAMFRYTPETAEIYSKLKSSRRFPEFNKAVKEMEANLEFSIMEPSPWDEPGRSLTMSKDAVQDSAITLSVVSLPHRVIEIPPSITNVQPEIEMASRSEVDIRKIPSELSHSNKFGSQQSEPVEAEAALLSKLPFATNRVDSPPPPAKRVKEETNARDSSSTAVPHASLRDLSVIPTPTKDPAGYLPKSNEGQASSKTGKVSVGAESAGRVESLIAPSCAPRSRSVSLGTKNTAVIPLASVPSQPATLCVTRAVESPAPAPAPSPPLNGSQPNTSLVTEENSVPVKIKSEVCDNEFLEKLYLYAQKNPERCDVTFAVGPDRVKIRSWRSFLVNASPELRRLFEETWDRAVTKESEGILLPDLDPETFKIFLKMMPLPTASITLEAMKELNLTVSLVFDLIGICTTFHMDTLLRVLEEYSKALLDNFEDFTERPEFLNTSSQILKTMLSSDNIPMKEIEIFKCAYKWAKHQCTKDGIEETPENIRVVLGDVIREIRYPLISIMDFGNIVFPTKILTDKETSNIFKSIALVEAGRSRFQVGDSQNSNDGSWNYKSEGRARGHGGGGDRFSSNNNGESRRRGRGNWSCLGNDSSKPENDD